MFKSTTAGNVPGRSLAVFTRSNEQVEGKLFCAFTSSHMWEDDVKMDLK